MNAMTARMGSVIALALLASSLSAQQKPEVPVVDAGAGACWVDFTVTRAGKPVYDAKVHTQVRYGHFHKTDVEVGTNYEGQARISGLPENVRKPPLTIDVHKDGATTMVTHDPATNCHAHYDVALPDVTLSTPR